MVPFESLGAVSCSPSIGIYGSILHQFPDKAIILLENHDFSYPLHSAPPLGGSPSEYCHPVWYGKTRMVGLPDGEKTLRICITVYTQYWHVTDGQTDGQADIVPQQSPHFAYTSHGKKCNIYTVSGKKNRFIFFTAFRNVRQFK